MGQALYRKYRSRGFDEVVGQDHIIKTLQNALKSGRISHAYLFTGPRGVGKTSVARILAREVNGLSYDEETIHLDIIEIDAASNRRIDEIRELRERVHIAPTSAKYKVYIIDEVHMLTREAFNALLKTLEEPPAHCIFILATTEAHKLPETIVSRTQRFNFKPATPADAVGHLEFIAKKEKIEIEPAALELLAAHGGGSLRDSIGLLDQLSGLGGKVTAEKAREFLGLPAAEAVKKLLAAVATGDVSATAGELDELRSQGIDSAMLARALNGLLREQLLSGASAGSVKLLRRLSRVGSATDPQAALEIDLLEASNANRSNATPAPINNPPPVSAAPPKPKSPDEAIPTPAAALHKAQAADMVLNEGSWGQVIAKVKSEEPSLYTALRLAQPRFEGDKLVLAFQFPLHQKKVMEARNIDALGSIIERLSGSKLKIECLIDKSLTPRPAKMSAEPEPNDESLQTINNIFGTAEVLES